MSVARDCLSRCSSSSAVRRIGPSRLVAIMASASASWWLRRDSRLCMMPALWMTAFSCGWSRSSWAATRVIAWGSPTSSATPIMPGLAWMASSSICWRRPAMSTRLPRRWNASARPRPMPVPPPVIRMVLPVSCMGASLSDPRRLPHRREHPSAVPVRLDGPAAATHGQLADQGTALSHVGHGAPGSPGGCDGRMRRRRDRSAAGRESRSFWRHP